MARRVLLSIPNLHATMDGGGAHPPDFGRPARGGFMAYCQNEHGEQMVLAAEHDGSLTLYHGDLAWRPVSIVEGRAPGIVLNAFESAWVALIASMWDGLGEGS